MSNLTSPRAADMLKPADITGHLLIILPLEVLPDFATVYGPADTIKVDVCDLNAQAADGSFGVAYRGVLWFNKILVNGLKDQIGDLVLGWMATGIGKPGQDPPFQLTNAMDNPQAVAVAEAWLKLHPEFENAAAPKMSSPAQAATPPAVVPSAPLPIPGTAPVAQPAMVAPAAAPAVPASNGAVAIPDTLTEDQKSALRALGFPV